MLDPSYSDEQVQVVASELAANPQELDRQRYANIARRILDALARHEEKK